MHRDARATATAFAPASVGNVAVGFDVLGHALPVIGDRVRALRVARRGVRIVHVDGPHASVPARAERNTAGVAALALLDALDADFGVELSIHKDIPLGAGLGGSAASAVGAVVAVNELLDVPLPKASLLGPALRGEAVASGGLHADNVAACLFGGLVLTVGIEAPVVRVIPVPDAVRCVVVRPHMTLATRAAREVLSRTVELSRVVWQSAHLAGLLAGCFSGDLELIRASLEDVMIEPQRSRLIPGFDAVKGAALESGALGCSISGAGPSLFAWCAERDAAGVSDAMIRAFREHGLASDSWTSAIAPLGAHRID